MSLQFFSDKKVELLGGGSVGRGSDISDNSGISNCNCGSSIDSLSYSRQRKIMDPHPKI